MKKNLKLFSIILIVLVILVIPINSFALDGIYDIQNELNSRYLDTSGTTVVTDSFGGSSQLWDLQPISGYPDVYRIYQPASGLYLDAYESETYKAVMRSIQYNTSQWWEVTPSYFGHYRIKQYNTNRYLNISSSLSYVFTSSYDNVSSQRWIID